MKPSTQGMRSHNSYNDTTCSMLIEIAYGVSHACVADDALSNALSIQILGESRGRGLFKCYSDSNIPFIENTNEFHQYLGISKM